MKNSSGAFLEFEGKVYSYFGGTSYYEFHRNPKVIDSAINALKDYGVPSASSRTSFGTTQLLTDLEKEAAEYFGCEASAYLPSSFLTDLAAITVLENENLFDIGFIDEKSHYSNEAAAKLSGKPL